MTGRARMSGLTSGEQDEARGRIAARFGPGAGYLSAAEAVELVQMATHPRVHPALPEQPPPTVDDALDALGLAGPARFHLEVVELEIMAYARHVLGVEWAPIGVRLGYAASGAKQGAMSRYASLAKRYPWVERNVKERAARMVADDQESGQE